MSNFAKRWIIFSVVIAFIIFLVFFVAPNIIIMLAPTFFPKVNISGFRNSSNTVSLLLAVLSVGLAVCSIIQARKGNLEMEKILNKTNNVLTGIEVIKTQQDIMNRTLWYSRFHDGQPPNNLKWKNDDIFE